MRHARCYLVAALLLGALVAVQALLSSSAEAQDKEKAKVDPPNVNWEYKVFNAGGGQGDPINEGKMEEALNKLGNEGWECVGTVSEVQGAKAGPPIWTKAVLIFKRPKR